MQLHPFIILGAAALAGCATGNCDPSQAGFFSGMSCEASGAYTQRNVSQQQTLAQSRAAALQQRAAASEAQDDATQAQLTLDQRQRRLRALDVQNASLQRRLTALRANNQVDQSRLASVQVQLDALRRQRAAVQGAPDDASVRNMEQQQQRLLEIAKGMGA